MLDGHGTILLCHSIHLRYTSHLRYPLDHSACAESHGQAIDLPNALADLLNRRFELYAFRFPFLHQGMRFAQTPLLEGVDQCSPAFLRESEGQLNPLRGPLQRIKRISRQACRRGDHTSTPYHGQKQNRDDSRSHATTQHRSGSCCVRPSGEELAGPTRLVRLFRPEPGGLSQQQAPTGL